VIQSAALNIMQKTVRIRRNEACVVIVDLQQKLLPAIYERERLIENTQRLVSGAAILEVPLLVTEQYPKGLGATAPEVANAIHGFAPMEKLTFSACGAPGFGDALKAAKASNIVLCGIEAHICVLQTCLDLLDGGLNVFVAGDAVSSRTAENRQIGLQRMWDAGATMVSTEMVLFELLGKASGEQFKKIIALVK